MVLVQHLMLLLNVFIRFHLLLGNLVVEARRLEVLGVLRVGRGRVSPGEVKQDRYFLSYSF